MMDLTALAQDMKHKCNNHPELPTLFNMNTGLRIRLQLTGIYWHLRLARDNQAPTEAEERSLREAFDVPQHAYRTQAHEGAEQSVQFSWDAGTIIVTCGPAPAGTVARGLPAGMH
jgi:hypothetical protein